MYVNDVIEGPTLDQVRILIHTSYEKGTFKLNRFHVAKNNVRRKFYFPESNVVDSEGKSSKDFTLKCFKIKTRKHFVWTRPRTFSSNFRRFSDSVLQLAHAGRFDNFRQQVIHQGDLKGQICSSTSCRSSSDMAGTKTSQQGFELSLLLSRH